MTGTPVTLTDETGIERFRGTQVGGGGSLPVGWTADDPDPGTLNANDNPLVMTGGTIDTGGGDIETGGGNLTMTGGGSIDTDGGGIDTGGGGITLGEGSLNDVSDLAMDGEFAQAAGAGARVGFLGANPVAQQTFNSGDPDSDRIAALEAIVAAFGLAVDTA